MHSLPRLGAGCAALLGVLVAAVPSWAAPPDTPAAAPSPAGAAVAPLPPDAAVAAALSVHPAVVAAARERLVTLGERTQTAALLGNPSLSGGVAVGGERASLALSQPLSLTGEGWAARAAASARLDAAEDQLQRARLHAAAEARKAYVEAVVARSRVRLAEESVALASSLRAAVRRQLEEGEASTLDLRLARLAEVQAGSALLDARAQEAQALVALAGLVARPVTAEALDPDPLAAAPPPAEQAPSTRADVRAAEATLRAAEQELRRQRAAAAPPLRLGASLDQEDGRTFVGPTLELELPLFDRNQVGRAAARGALQLAQAERDAVTARADTDVSTARARVAEAHALAAALVADPVAEAREALRSVEAGYRAGELDLPTTILLQGEVLDGEAAALWMRGQVAEARIDLLLATEDPQLLGGAR